MGGANLYHIQLNVSKKESLQFYKEFLKYFGYRIIDESEKYIGLSNRTTDFWIMQTDKKYAGNKFHRKNIGLNHLAFSVGSGKEVDNFVKKFLEKRKIKSLYNSPKKFPEYNKEYYAVYFEDPDRIKLEVVYLGDEKKR